MAENNLKFPYVIRQDTSSNPRKSGKYYGRSYPKGLLDTRGLAEHMTEHGLVRNTGRVYSAVEALRVSARAAGTGCRREARRTGHLLSRTGVARRGRPHEVLRTEAHQGHTHPHTALV